MTVSMLAPDLVPAPQFARWWIDEAMTVPSGGDAHSAVERLLIEAACKGTLEEAIRHTVHTLTGSDVHTVVAQLERMVVFRVDGGVAWVRWTPAPESQWDAMDGLMFPHTAAARRATHLRLVLNSDSFTSTHTAQQTLSSPWEGMSWKPLVTAGALSMWWHDQMAQGADPSATRMLLNLLVPASSLSKISLAEDGQTPVYTGLPSEVYRGHVTTFHPHPAVSR
jgi:hypothetical protein